jgi:HD-GYP domain-containing protein (c-di-GMP phosphodiesterase class II)
MAVNAIDGAYLHAELRDSYLSTVRSLANSLDARDNYTAAHAHRVAALAMRMAEQLGLSEDEITDIEVFGPLHDVGKIGIRDSVLLKMGPLSETEQSACREHTIIGERILRPLKPSREALAMVRNHHEAWDGTGYPDGLAGEEIPLLARVLQVADCYDAMVSDRPYQAAMSEQEVLAHFQQYAGKRYDPAVVRSLRAVMREGRDLPSDDRPESGFEATGLQAVQAEEPASPAGVSPV